MANDIENKKKNTGKKTNGKTSKKTDTNKSRKLKIILIAFAIIGFILYCFGTKQNPIEVASNIYQQVQGESPPQGEAQSQGESQGHSETITNVNGEMEVHFLDVGQADSTLIIQNGKTMLFDVATKSKGDDIADYIKDLGINYVDVLVLSHPHDDHLGGTADFLKNMEVGVIYCPDFRGLGINNIWYIDMLNQINLIDAKRNKNVPPEEQTSILRYPRNDQGEFATFNIGDAKVQFLAPLEDKYSDKNNYSICAKISYGTVDLMLTGDAHEEVEKELIQKDYDLDIEIFQAGHHGSDTSNSKEFINAMSPEAIVISCGMQNKHGHPVKSVMDLFKKKKIPVYRTDESGTIVMVTDGEKYAFNKAKGTYKSGAEYNKGD